jgi:hypothetical protein
MTQDKAVEKVLSELTGLRARMADRERAVLDGLVLRVTPEVTAHKLSHGPVPPFRVVLKADAYKAQA